MFTLPRQLLARQFRQPHSTQASVRVCLGESRAARLSPLRPEAWPLGLEQRIARALARSRDVCLGRGLWNRAGDCEDRRRWQRARSHPPVNRTWTRWAHGSWVALSLLQRTWGGRVPCELQVGLRGHQARPDTSPSCGLWGSGLPCRRGWEMPGRSAQPGEPRGPSTLQRDTLQGDGGCCRPSRPKRGEPRWLIAVSP